MQKLSIFLLMIAIFTSPGKVYNQQLLEQNQMHGVNNLDLDS